MNKIPSKMYCFRAIPIFFIIILGIQIFYSQQKEFIITEGSETEICGRTIVIDGFWINNYKAVADLSVYSNKLWKPITGGYSLGDTIDISKDCRYYVVSVEKNGMNRKGTITLSLTPDILYKHSHPDLFIMNSKDKYKFGDEEWMVKKISNDSAEINIMHDNKLKESINIKKNDVIWFGEYAFYVIDLDHLSSEVKMKKVSDYSYINFPVIPGEMINKPADFPESDEELIIRKMKLYPKMRVDEEEYKNTPVKYWVLRVFYYHRGIASPVIKIKRNGKDMMVEYMPYKSFDTEDEVLEFARINNVTDIELEN